MLAAVLLLFVWARCDSADDQADTQPPVSIPFSPFTLPEGFAAEVFVEGLNLPTSIAFAPDGTNRLFVNELQTGRIVENGVLRDEPFATLETNVVPGGGREWPAGPRLRRPVRC